LGPGFRAAAEGGRRRRFADRLVNTYYAGGAGGPTAIKQTGLSHRVFQITEGIPNAAPEAAQKWETAFRAKEGVSLFYPRAVNEMRMLAKAAAEAKSTDSKALAQKLEGMKIVAFDGGEAFMRKEDHQFFQDVYISSFGTLDQNAKFDEEGTGWGWKSVGVVKANDTLLPTTCKMERP
jgi:branched-chain amino acid transport system substrate-binding protein